MKQLKTHTMQCLGTRFMMVALSLLCFNSISAQTYDSFKQKRQEDFRKFKEQRAADFQAFVGEREQYIKKLDRQFERFLKKYWEDYSAFKTGQAPQKPGPKEAPDYQDQPMDKVPGQPIQKVESKAPPPEQVHLPVLQKTSNEEKPAKTLATTFFGASLDYNMPENIKPYLPATISKNDIAREWKRLSNTNYYPVIDKALTYKNRYNLNDWGYYLLLKKLSNKICEQQSSNAICLQWFLLTKSQYDTRLGFNEQSLHLLLPFRNAIYNERFFKVNNQRYYNLNSDAQNLTIYRKNYQEATRVMDLNLRKSPNLSLDAYTTTISFRGHDLDFKVNKNLMDFYNTFPQAGLPVYFNAALDAVTKESIHKNLQSLIKGQNEQDAVTTILNFVQQFKYKTDQEQFGEEKFFFPAEVFYYPYADCEDRSSLFSYIVRELLGLEVVALEYPRHVASAVRLSKEYSDPSFQYNGKQYVICDPTYQGAPMGHVIPQCKDKKAKVLALNRQAPDNKRAKALWKMVDKAGGHKASINDNIAFDDEDQAYLTGYFSGSLKIGSQSLASPKDQRDVFVACFNKDNKVKWLKAISGSGQDLGYHILYAHKENALYLAGAFNQEISNGHKTFNTQKQADMFLARLSRTGQTQWVGKAGLSKLKAENNANFVVCFDKSGKHVWNRVFNESKNFDDYGINSNAKDQILINGGVQRNTGFRTKHVTGPGDPQGGVEVLRQRSTGVKSKKAAYNSANEFDAIQALKNKTDEFENKQYHPTVAGLFGVIELLRNSGMAIEGAEVQKALDKYNPTFKSQNPTIYKNIGMINFIKNTNGIIEIETQDGSSVSFSNMEIADGSRIKLTRHASGNVVIDVLSGIEVGKAIVWYDLNSIKLHCKKPDLVFDYSDDHTKKTVLMNELIK